VRWLEAWYIAASILAAAVFDAAWRRPEWAVRARRSLECALLAVGTAALGGAFWLATRPFAPFWVDAAQEGARRAADRRWTAAHILRSIGVSEALALFAICVTFLLLSRWSRQRGSASTWGRVWSCGAVALLGVELLALFWRSARPWQEPDSNVRSRYPASLVARYSSGERWDTRVDWRGLNSALPQQVDLFNGYDALNTSAFWQLAREVEGREWWRDMYQPHRRGPALRVAGVTHTLSWGDAPLLHSPNARLVASQGHWKLWQRSGAWPRAYLSRRVALATPAEAGPLLSRLASAPRGTLPVVLHHGAPSVPPAQKATAKIRERATWKRLSPNHFVVDYSASAPSWLVVSEAFFPGWRVYQQFPLFPASPARTLEPRPANVLFQAVPVSPGRSRVAWVYEPQSWRLGMFLSLCTLGLCSGAAAFALVRRARNAKSNAPST
jgi:hypothetical protein